MIFEYLSYSLLIITSVYFSYRSGMYRGYEKGIDRGIEITLDEIKQQLFPHKIGDSNKEEVTDKK